MKKNEEEIIDSPNDAETTEEQEEDSGDEVETLKKKVATLSAQKDHWRKKAETKDDEPEVKPTPEPKDKKEGSLSPTEIYALIEAKVPKEDIDEAQKVAQIINKPLAEALNDPLMKTTLQLRAEERKTANAANTKTVRPSVKTPTGNEVLEDAKAGKMPEKGSEEAMALFRARKGIENS